MKKIYILILIISTCLLCANLCVGQDFTLKIENQQIILPMQQISNEWYTPAVDLFIALGGEIKEVKDTSTLFIILKNKNILLSTDTSYFVLDGKLIQICCNVIFKNKKWYVPLDLIKKIAENIYNTNYFWNPHSEVMIVGYDENNLLKIDIENTEKSEKIIFAGKLDSDYRVTEENSSIGIKFLSKSLITPPFSRDINDNFIKSIYYKASQNEGMYVLELKAKNILYNIYESDNGKKLIIEFPKQPKEKEAKKETKEAKPAVPPEEKQKTPVQQNLFATIVIDPGHGGDETGAIGPKGSFEKDITLSIARKLKSHLETKLGLKVFLTRDQDKTLGLVERTAIANNLKANIFISIHANASYRKIASGAETYFLTLEATDEETLSLAKQENKAPNNNATNTDLNLILWDLAQTEHLQESSQLAEIIQEELNKDLNIKNRGIKQAPFRVLMGADMPAVLIEVGFITNPKEEELLNQDDYQRMLANSILRSIQKFKTIKEQKYGISPAPKKQSDEQPL